VSDPTKNVPWRVCETTRGGVPYFEVTDSVGHIVFGCYHNAALARMVAAGSVAGELYAKASRLVAVIRDRHHGRMPDEVANAFNDANAALAAYTALLERKEGA
jgi:hypothetical protein